MNKKRIMEYTAPSLLAGTLFLIILAMNGLWPFGKATIDYFDMAQWAYPFYYHNYDELHGLKSFIFDWYTNLGRVIPGLNEPSLFDLLFYFVPRDRMLEGMSILMTIKIMASAFTMNLFIRYINEKLPHIYRMMLAAGYGLCGFVLMNYTVPMWLDMAVIVPLVLMYSQIALRSGKFLGLSVTIFLLMIDDYYYTIQTLMFVFLIGGAYVLYTYITGRRSQKKEQLHVTALLLGVVSGLAFSAFSWVPDIAFAMTSARFGNGVGSGGLLGDYMDLLREVQPSYLSRWFSLLSLSVPTALTLIGMLDLAKKKNTGAITFRIVCIFMVTIQLFVESIHLILHFGSYVNYPVRNGFMIYCIVAAIAAASYERPDDVEKPSRTKCITDLCAGIFFAVLIMGAFRYWYVRRVQISDHDILIITMSIMTLFTAINIALMTVKKGAFREYCVFLFAVEITIFGTIMIGKPLYDTPYGNEYEQESEFIRITDQLADAFGSNLETGSAAALCRIKNPDTSLNSNYGVVMQRETLCGWTNLASADQINGAVLLGYSNQFTRILDSGGNIFSDTILHITDIISNEKQDDALYEKVGETTVVTDHMTGAEGEYYLYRNRYEMPFAIPVKDDTLIRRSFGDTVEMMNAYAGAFGADRDIAAYILTEPREENSDGHEIREYRINVNGKKALYLTGKCTDTEYYNTYIFVNETPVRIPSIKENDNLRFPAHFNNNTVALGTFEDEEVTVKIDMNVSDPEQKYEYSLYEIDTALLEEICRKMPEDIIVTRGRSSLEIDFDGLSEGYDGFLIPVSYDRGWSAYVNGVKTGVQGINGLFMFVPATDASGKIEMKYFPPYMAPGAVVAVVGALCVILIPKIKKKKLNTGPADRIIGVVYIIAFAAAFVLLYGLPLIYAVISRI